MAEICVFHIGLKHSLRDCTVLKEELDILEEPKRPRGNDFNDHHYKVLTQNVHLAPNTQQAEQAGFTRAESHETCQSIFPEN
jgi:hypothetical protein